MKSAKSMKLLPTLGAEAAGIGGKLQTVMALLQEGRRDELTGLVKARWQSTITSFGLVRDLGVPFPAPAAAMPLTIRPLRQDDIPRLLDPDGPDVAPEGRAERLTRLHMLDAGLETCYVAVTADDTPCYMQWLIGPEQNEQVQHYFKGIFPLMVPGEALLEGAFTPEAFRGQRIMPCAMAQLAEKGRDLGARRVITFVTCDNIPSLKGCKRAGFSPYLLRTERWHSFLHDIGFVPLPEGTPYPFDAEAPKPASAPRHQNTAA